MSMPSSMYFSSRQRMAAFSNSPSTRRNRVECKQCKRPILTSTPTPDRKRSSAIKNRNANREDVELSLVDLPVLALARVFFYLPLKDRLSLSQTCHKLRQTENYERRHRCTLNVRNDLTYLYKESLQCGGLASSKAVFGSTELFQNVLHRSFSGRAGAVCSIEKIACIDFSPPQRPDGLVADHKAWGGRMFVTELSLRFCFGRIPATSVVELRLHHCYVSVGALNTVAGVFAGLEKLSLSLKGLEFPTADTKTPNLDECLASAVCNWSNLVTKKKKLFSPDVKEMIASIYCKFPLLEVFLLYNE